MKNFDHFVGIDWTGAEKPVYTPSIAVAECNFERDDPPKLYRKKWSRTDVYEWIKSDVLKRKGRSLIGIDCNFGYAEVIGEQQFGKDYTYRDLWSAVEKSSQSYPNFFAKGYWQHPAYRSYFWTTGKKPDDLRLAKRVTERVCQDCGYGTPESPFKMIGAKQVGKGGLSGMRMAYALKRDIGSQIAFWPFEDISACNQALAVITEIYPRQFLKRAGHGNTKVRSLDDLNAALAYFETKTFQSDVEISDHDTDAVITAAGLRALCGQNKDIPKALSHPDSLSYKIAKREGWIFGAGDINLNT